MDDRAYTLLERIAAGVEKLTDPVDMNELIRDTQPFTCPACGTVNPTITSLSENMSGKAMDFVLKAECGNCHKTLYAIPNGWEVFDDRDSILSAIRERQNGRN